MEVERCKHEVEIEKWKVTYSNGIFELGGNYLGKVLDEILFLRQAIIEIDNDFSFAPNHPDYRKLVEASRGPVEKITHAFGSNIDKLFCLENWINTVEKYALKVRESSLKILESARSAPKPTNTPEEKIINT